MRLRGVEPGVLPALEVHRGVFVPGIPGMSMVTCHLFRAKTRPSIINRPIPAIDTAIAKMSLAFPNANGGGDGGLNDDGAAPLPATSPLPSSSSTSDASDRV